MVLSKHTSKTKWNEIIGYISQNLGFNNIFNAVEMDFNWNTDKKNKKNNQVLKSIKQENGLFYGPILVNE